MATNTTTAEKQIHPRMKEALDNAKKAAVSNRGIYPYTKATNVYETSGSPLEELPSDETKNEPGEDPGNLGGQEGQEPENPPEDIKNDDNPPNEGT